MELISFPSLFLAEALRIAFVVGSGSTLQNAKSHERDGNDGHPVIDACLWIFEGSSWVCHCGDSGLGRLGLPMSGHELCAKFRQTDGGLQ